MTSASLKMGNIRNAKFFLIITFIVRKIITILILTDLLLEIAYLLNLNACDMQLVSDYSFSLYVYIKQH